MTNWIRKTQLSVGGHTFVGGTTEPTLRCEFSIVQSIGNQPGWMDCTITNVPRDVGKAIAQSCVVNTTPVTFMAGYEEGLFGQIFNGTFVWASFGKKNPTDTFLQIQAQCNGGAHNFAVVTQRLQANCTALDVVNACVQAMGQFGVSLGQVPTQALQKLIYPRGVSLFGMARDYVTQISNAFYSRWHIDNQNNLNIVPLNGYLNGPWQINAATGMIGMPVFTPTGLVVRTLINPTYNVGDLIELDPSTITIGSVSPGISANSGQAEVGNFNNALAGYDSGVFKILDIKWNGDTRGQPFYADLTCMVANGNIPTGAVIDVQPSVPAGANSIFQTRN